MADAIIVDRGYRRYEGARNGRAGAVQAIIREGIRRTLGLRRKARRKVLPWTLIAITFIGVSVFLGIHFVASAALGGGIDLNLPRNGEFFDFVSVIWLLFIAMAAPELLVPDRTQGVLSVYFSRPLRVGDYLAAKAAALALLVLSAYLIPQVVLHLGLASLSADGFLVYLRENLDVLWKITAVSFVYLAVHGSIAMAVSAVIPRRGLAAGAFLGGLLILNGLAAAASNASFAAARYFALAAFEQHPRIVRDWVFDITTVDYIPIAAGFEPWHSLVVAVAIVVVSWLIVSRRYRRLA
jgi:ABC-2 type transport system permease protein